MISIFFSLFFIVPILYILYIIYNHRVLDTNLLNDQNILPGDGRKTCIFCGSKDLSGEHVFPKWTKTLIRKTYAKHNFGFPVYSIDKSGKESVDFNVSDYNSDPGAKKLRVVCRGCNNGWMSLIQTAAKPVLTPMIVGDQYELNRNKKLVLCVWATMSAIVSEYLFSDQKGASPTERATFYLNKKPIKGWQVWLGRNASKFRLNYRYLPINYRIEPDNLRHGINIYENEVIFISIITIEDLIIIVTKQDFLPQQYKLFNNLERVPVLIDYKSTSPINWSDVPLLRENDLNNIIARFGSMGDVR